MRIAESGELRRWMSEYITSVLDLPAESLSHSATFDTCGIDSVEAIVMAGVMEEHFGVEIDPMLFFEDPSIDAFVAAHGGPADAG
jgi:acyl carrier protein